MANCTYRKTITGLDTWVVAKFWLCTFLSSALPCTSKTFSRKVIIETLVEYYSGFLSLWFSLLSFVDLGKNFSSIKILSECDRSSSAIEMLVVSCAKFLGLALTQVLGLLLGRKYYLKQQTNIIRLLNCKDLLYLHFKRYKEMKPLICHKLDQSVSTIRLAFTNEQFKFTKFSPVEDFVNWNGTKINIWGHFGRDSEHVAIELKMQPGTRQISFQSVLPIIVPIIP